MAVHEKTRILRAIKAHIGMVVARPSALRPARGTKYFVTNPFIVAIIGALDTVKSGQKRRARIVVRPSRHHPGLHELYTYHFPNHWPDACERNRALMAIARRQAHDIEHDHSYEALEWRVRFIANYNNPEPGMKPYAHLYHYVYNSILQSLRKELQLQTTSNDIKQSQTTSNDVKQYQTTSSEDVSFEPIISRHYPYRPLTHQTTRHTSLHTSHPNKWQLFCKIIA